MSLMLRKRCQPSLDDAGLANYHVDIHNQRYDAKHLCIVGECGQPFVTLHGVSFAKLTPTRAEIDYAAELLEDFLGTHKLKIDAYLEAAHTFKAKTPPPDTYDDERIRITSGYRMPENGVQYRDGYFNVVVEADGNIRNISISENYKSVLKTPITKQVLLSLTFDNDLYEEAMQFRNDYAAYVEELKEVEELKMALSRCEI